jgi:hypothetical protein
MWQRWRTGHQYMYRQRTMTLAPQHLPMQSVLSNHSILFIPRSHLQGHRLSRRSHRCTHNPSVYNLRIMLIPVTEQTQSNMLS